MRNSNDAYDVKSSPRLFWQGRESASPFPKSQENQAPYDPEMSYSTSKRPSLENLKRQSRVRNSNMLRDYNQEYDPASVYVPQRPLVTNRSPQKESHSMQASQKMNKQETGPAGPRPPSPSKEQAPPAKSSLSRASRFGVKDMGFDPESEIWSDADNRHAKSVTFDAAPPQVNEYEMTTPDPSSIASGSREGSYESEEDEFPDISFDRDSSTNRDDSFDASLEDLEKTPVVLPEDWRYMSPSSANDDLVKEDEDPFTEDDESHNPDPQPSRQELSDKNSRVEPLDSNGERRPLPPLPGRTSFSSLAASPSKLAAAFELGSGGQRVLPLPPGPASYSKSDITDFGHSSMSLEDRLRLMMIQENGQENPVPERQELETHSKGDNEDQAKMEAHADQPEQHDSHASDETLGDASDIFSAPHISRDSILRDLRRSESFLDDSFDDDSQIPSSPNSYMNYDPDVPIPSLESDDAMLDDSDDDDDDTKSVVIKQEEHDNDLYDIPDYYGPIPSKDSSFKSLKGKLASDDESHYSSPQVEDDSTEKASSQTSDDGQATPVPADRDEKSLSEQEPNDTQQETESAPKMAAIQEALQRPITPEGRDQISEPSTPDSVIRHPIDDDASDGEISADENVPDPIATVKAPGTTLKTRPSLTPADLESMAATRRRISGQHPPPMPSLTKQHSNESEKSAPDTTTPSQPPKEVSQRQSSLVKLDIPFSIQEESLGFGLDKEFDRVIENQKVALELSISQLYSRTGRDTHAQGSHDNHTVAFANDQIPKQRGYLMRHNTKVIIASSSRNDDEPATASGGAPTDSRGTKPAAPTPRKASQQTWTTVPWNGQPRRASIRQASGIRKKPVPGPMPPLPGQQSNVQETPATIEESEPALNGALDEGEERGRLFVKVVGMKYLDLPLPRGEFLIVKYAQETPIKMQSRREIVLFSHSRQRPPLCYYSLAGTRKDGSNRSGIRTYRAERPRVPVDFANEGG
jgi:hypothetical protein